MVTYPPPPRASGIAGNEVHWLDKLEAGVKAHILAVSRSLLDAASADPEAIKLGAGLNKGYAAALRMGKGQHTNVLERAKYEAEDYLAHFPPERLGAILLGALASVYGKEDRGADTAVWLAGNKGETVLIESNIAQQTIEALREAGILDDIMMTKERLVDYLAELAAEER